MEKQELKLTFTGMPLKDTSANAITITKQTAGTKDHPVTAPGQNLYNVVFEACTGKDVIRAPEVKITSDVDEKNSSCI